MIRLCAFSDEADDSLGGQIAALQSNGITLTELRSVDGKNVSEFSEREAKKVGKRLRDEGISVWSVGSPLGKCGIEISEADWRECVKRICAVANALQTDKIRAFSFYRAYQESEKVIELMNLAAVIASDFGVTLYHENEKEVYGDTVYRVKDLMRRLQGWEFVCDPANFIQVGERAEEFLPLAPRCGYYHIKDAIARTGEIVPAGEGDGAIERLIFSIEKDAVLTVEPHLAVFSSYSRIDNSEMKLKYSFKSNIEAFDAAVCALKKLLEKGGWQFYNGGYEKNGSGT